MPKKGGYILAKCQKKGDILWEFVIELHVNWQELRFAS